MNRFAELLDALLFTPSRNGKLRLMAEYFATQPDSERGWALAALTGELAFAEAKPGQVRALAMARVDPVLFAWSLDFVGDLAETVSLIWPEPSHEPSPSHGFAAGPGRSPETGEGAAPTLSEIVATLQLASRADVGAHLASWLDRLDATGRWALLKLVTGALRIGVSARLAKTALAEWAKVEIGDIEEIWHGLTPPYEPLFAWLDGNAPRPQTGDLPNFTPLMLSQPLEESRPRRARPARAYFAEWKWDGIRTTSSWCRASGERRLYSRSGDEIGPAFPDIVAAIPDDIALDGELLVIRGGEVAPFNDLQQRLNRKTPTAKMLADYPASVRLYDILRLGDEDLRALPLAERRHRLDAWYGNAPRERLDLSPLVPFESWDDLKALRDEARANGIEGADAEPPRLGLSVGPAVRAVVHVDARRADHRRGADVRPARPRPRSARRSIPTTRSAPGATIRSCTGRQGLFRLYRRRIAPAPRQMGARQHRQAATARCAGGAGPGAGDRLRQRAPLDAPQIRRRDALSARPPHPLGQALSPRPIRWRIWRG